MYSELWTLHHDAALGKVGEHKEKSLDKEIDSKIPDLEKVTGKESRWNLSLVDKISDH